MRLRLSLPLALSCLLAASSGLAAATPAARRSSAPPRAPVGGGALPAIARTGLASAVRAADPRIEGHRQKWLTKARAGRPVSMKKAAREQELAAIAAQINHALRTSRDDRPILIILEGPDGAGKSSTMRRLEPAFAGARAIQRVHFGAPPENAEQVHWVKRFFDQLPEKGTVMFWDRSYYGRAVYDPHYGLADKPMVKQTLREIKHLEGLLKDKVHVLKFFLDTPGDRLAETLGKREALAPEKLSDSDYAAFRDRKAIRKLFGQAIARTERAVPWHVISMRDRARGRADLLKVLATELGAR